MGEQLDKLKALRVNLRKMVDTLDHYKKLFEADKKNPNAMGNDGEGAVGNGGLWFLSVRDVACLVEWSLGYEIKQRF